VTLGGKETEPVTSMAKGSYVKITIQNHGKGIPKQEIGKIFESYFSLERIMTRKKNGLGAATILPIIKKHGGYVHIDSKAGTGAILYVYLPAAGKGRGDRASQC
jgi:signal transduction histidine kinase